MAVERRHGFFGEDPDKEVFWMFDPFDRPDLPGRPWDPDDLEDV